MKLKQTLAVALIVCMAVSLLGSVSVSAGMERTTPTTLSLKSSISNTEGQGNLVTGQSFFVYGWLSNAKTGAGLSERPIQLSYYDGDNWQYATVWTGSNGYYSYTLSLPHSSYYGSEGGSYTIQADFYASSTWASSSNSVNVWVDPAPTRITFYPTTFINANTPTTLNGWVQNVKTGKPVANQFVDVGFASADLRYGRFIAVSTDSSGHFSLPLTWGAIQLSDGHVDGGPLVSIYNLYTHTYQNPEIIGVRANYWGHDWAAQPDYLSSWSPAGWGQWTDVSVWGNYNG